MALHSPIEDTGCSWTTKQRQKNKYWNIPLNRGTVTPWVTQPWKPLHTLWLLQPSSQCSFWPQAFWKATGIALVEVYQRKKLKGCGVQHQPWPLQSSSAPYWQRRCSYWLILFFGRNSLLFSCLTAPRWHLHYLIWRGILTRGHPDIPKGWKRGADGCSLLSLLLPQVIRLHGSPSVRKRQLGSFNCRK